jgi:hypothetical protein
LSRGYGDSAGVFSEVVEDWFGRFIMVALLTRLPVFD